MPKIFFSFFALSLLFLAACDDIRTEKYPSGKPYRQVRYENGVKNGIETEYYESGAVKRTRNFVQGKEQGESEEFYESGKIRGTFHYRDGALDGTAKRFYENGQVQSITLYKMGTVAGFPQTFDSDGDPEIQGSYEDSRDGNRYEWVRVGNAVWTAENIKYAPVKGSVCMQCNIWGRLYNWNSAQKACPPDFRIPSVSDWEKLFQDAGTDPVKKLKASFGWNDNGNGTDEFGFGLRASGAHFEKASVPEKSRKFKDAGDKAYLWTANGTVAVFKKNSNRISFEKFNPEFGASLRCVLGDQSADF